MTDTLEDLKEETEPTESDEPPNGTPYKIDWESPTGEANDTERKTQWLLAKRITTDSGGVQVYRDGELTLSISPSAPISVERKSLPEYRSHTQTQSPKQLMSELSSTLASATSRANRSECSSEPPESPLGSQHASKGAWREDTDGD